MFNASTKELQGRKHDLIMQQYSSPLHIKACIFEEGLHAHLKSLLPGKMTREREREGVRWDQARAVKWSKECRCRPCSCRTRVGRSWKWVNPVRRCVSACEQKLRFAVACFYWRRRGGGRPALGSLLPSPACSQFIHHSAHTVNDLEDLQTPNNSRCSL